MAENVRNHLASCAYLRGFTGPDGTLAVVNLKSRSVRRRPPEKVGYRKYFWGHDEQLRNEVEGLLARIEAHVPRILGDFVSQGPPAHGSDDRALLLQFLAMQLVRNPAWRRVIADIRERQILVRGHDRPGWERWREQVRADRFWIDAMLRQIPQIAALLGSTHWALLRFPGRWLATCDQPLVPMPLLRKGERVRVGATPALLETIEFRFVVDPCHAVILSWHDAPDWTAWLTADQQIAADINRSVVGRADIEYFHRPETEPAFVAPPWMPTDECSPISPKLHDSYWREAARSSERRRRSEKILLNAIEREITDEIETVVVR